MSKIIKELVDLVDPKWNRSRWDIMGLDFPDYIRNKKVTKLFSDNKVISWQIDGGYIWLEVKSY